ncbi:TPA: hypothetical protein ACGOR8_001960 [Streptococcus suis]
MNTTQYYIENTIHTNYSRSLFFGKLANVSESINNGLVRVSLLCLDGTNPRLLTYLNSTIKLPISSNSKDRDKIFFDRNYNEALLASTHIFIYDPLGVIDEIKFNRIRNKVAHIFYLTNEKIFDKHYLNFLTEQNALYINQSIFVNRIYCYKASLLFENTSEAFLKLYNSNILKQRWYCQEGYIGLKEQNSEGTLLVYNQNEGAKKVGVFNIDTVEEEPEPNFSVKNDAMIENSLNSLSEILNRVETQLMNNEENLLKQIEKIFEDRVLNSIRIEHTYEEEEDPLAPFRI